jgi:hypothetical protein
MYRAGVDDSRDLLRHPRGRTMLPGGHPGKVFPRAETRRLEARDRERRPLKQLGNARDYVMILSLT